MLTVRKKMVSVILFSSGLLSATAFSAPPPTTTLQLGPAFPMIGDLKDIADPGLFIGAQVMHHASPHDSIGIGVGYFSFGKDSADQVDTEVSVISTLALMRHDLADKKSGTPFVETGFGFARTQVNIAASNAGGPAITRGTNEEDISPTFLLGLGLDMPISNGATLGLSVHYQHFFFKVGDVDGGGSLSLLANLRV